LRSLINNHHIKVLGHAVEDGRTCSSSQESTGRNLSGLFKHTTSFPAHPTIYMLNMPPALRHPVTTQRRAHQTRDLSAPGLTCKAECAGNNDSLLQNSQLSALTLQARHLYSKAAAHEHMRMSDYEGLAPRQPCMHAEPAEHMPARSHVWILTVVQFAACL
jgi:hypothetical protein